MTAADAAPQATRPAVGVLTVVLVIGCTADPRTEVLLVVDAEPEVRSMASHLELRVLGASADADDWREVRAQTLGSPVDWPRSLGLVPRDGESLRRFDVRAVARQGVDGPVVAQARVLSSYVPEQTRELRLTLEDACIGRSCAETETCRAGMCMPPEPIDPQSLVRLDGPPASTGGCPEEMLRVPAEGATVTFVMGSPEGVGEDDERPETQVTLDAYCLDRTEVTVEAYAVCVDGGGCVPTGQGTGFICPTGCNGDDRSRAHHPINCVSWEMADAFCRWRGARLPTEAEWELSASGPRGRTYAWGDTAPTSTLVNALGPQELATVNEQCRMRITDATSFVDDGHVFTAPVGSYPAGAGPYGHVDLAGNVYEWVSDWYAPYSGGTVMNPTGPAGPTEVSAPVRVARGGGWDTITPAFLRAARRDGVSPVVAEPNYGFRCAQGGS